MQIIKFNVRNQRLTRFTSGVITEGSYSYLKFEFNFKTEDWNKAEAKTVVFSYKGKNYEEKLDQYNQCYVRKEAIHTPYFKVSLYSEDICTNTVKIPVEVASSGSSDTPDIDDDKPISGNINIFDGGAIIVDSSDKPTEDDNSSPDDETGVVDYITKNKIPFYIGLVENESSMVAYQQLDTSTANYADQGFYTTTSGGGKITDAGYQMVFEGNDDGLAQIFLICSAAKIVTAHQYQPAFNQWLDMGFDGTYWVEDGTITKIVNGKEVTFTTYIYNAELMGDVITATEYWRFEVEVL